MTEPVLPVANVGGGAPRPALRGVRWGLVDQFLSSGTNFALAFLLVREVDARSFGAFSLVVLIYVIAIGTMTALNGQPLIIRSGGVTAQIEAGVSRALGVAVLVGAVIGTMCLIAAALVSGPLKPLLVILGLCLPLLLAQDTGRGIYFGLGRPKSAAANDAAWAFSMVVVLGVLATADALTQPAMVAAWLGSGALLGLAMIFQLKSSPAGVRAATRRLRDNLPLGSPLLGSYLLTIAPSYLVFALAPAIAGLGELGLARAAYLPFAAFGVLLQGATLLLLPAVAGKDPAAVIRLARRGTLALGSGALAWAALVQFGIPPSVGELVLGRQWQRTEELRAIFGVALIAQAVGITAVIGLASLAAGRLFRMRLLTGPIAFACGIVLTYFAGATGLAIGIVVGDAATAAAAWLTLRKLSRQPPKGAALGN